MRLIRITTNYPSYLDRFYGERPSSLAAAPYDSQQKELMSDLFGWADFWGRALRPLGYDSREIVANAEPLQRAWAMEHGKAPGERTWLLDVVTEQVRELRPDVLFVDDYMTFTAPFIGHLRSICPEIRLVLGWVGAPCSDLSPLRAYDRVLSNIPELADSLSKEGFPVRHLHHAFDPAILEHLRHPADKQHPLVFVGSLIRGNEFHSARIELLTTLAARTDIRVFVDAAQPPLRTRAARAVRSALHRAGVTGAPDPGLASSLLRAVRPPVFGREMYQTLAESRVSLNSHIGASPLSASNMRLFESTGAGACLLTETRENLRSIFEPEKEVVTYSSVEECVERAEWLAAHPGECDAIGRAGQKRTLRDHTFANRAVRLNEIIQEALRT